ncbi:MAG TPA: hypothetical protein VFY26_22260 [Anaerolineales bacterium]|nr:hypothetical protein [Anaerolineales bacterium]
MDQSESKRIARLAEVSAILVLAFIGGMVGSLAIGIVGVLLTYIYYPNVELEHGAAMVGAFCGSLFSIPIGIAVGGAVGLVIYFALLKLTSLRPVFFASAAAFATGALAAGLALVPIGFVFFGLGHI